jgi:hypothetical protein
MIDKILNTGHVFSNANTAKKIIQCHPVSGDFSPLAERKMTDIVHMRANDIKIQSAKRLTRKQ